MNNYLLKRQVDELFCSKSPDKFAAWRVYRTQIRNKVQSPNRNQRSPPVQKKPYEKSQSKSPIPTSKSPTIQKAKQAFDKIFQKKLSKDEFSIDSVSEIPEKPDIPTISLKTNGLSDILPLETIELIRLILKTPLNETRQYKNELKNLAEDILKNLNSGFIN